MLRSTLSGFKICQVNTFKAWKCSSQHFQVSKCPQVNTAIYTKWPKSTHLSLKFPQVIKFRYKLPLRSTHWGHFCIVVLSAVWLAVHDVMVLFIALSFLFWWWRHGKSPMLFLEQALLWLVKRFKVVSDWLFEVGTLVICIILHWDSELFTWWVDIVMIQLSLSFLSRAGLP